MKWFKRKNSLIKALAKVEELNEAIKTKDIFINSLNKEAVMQYERIAALEYKNQELVNLCKETIVLAKEQNARTKVNMN